MRWLILIPYYFFGALALQALFILVCRLLRVKPDINAIVWTAILLSMATLVVPLATGMVKIDTFRALPMLALGLTSFFLAGLDAALMRLLPLPLDKDLQEL